MSCASCGGALLAGAKFCAECGAAAAVGCRSCGTELTPAVKFCPECGTPTAAPDPAAATVRPVAERRVTSVMFGDLVGFTTLSESRDPEEVRELLGHYFDTARRIVVRYGGTIEKFIGDAVMAVWGVPTAHEDDADRAVRAGMDLTEAVAAFGESVGAPGLAMRVGVVTGEVAVTVGATDQGMVAGDAVNTAARVQAKAEPGSVWVDGQTRSLVGASIDFRNVGKHELKGKSAPVELFEAVAVMGGVGGDRSTDRVQGPLVGRRRELSMLKEMFHVAAEEHRPRLVVLSGDAGVGKSRLGRELENYLDGLSAGVLWHSGRCLAYGDGVAFSALNAAVRGRIGASDDDTEATTREKLARSLELYVPDPAERAWLTPPLAGLLGLGDGTGLTREDLFSAWLAWFECLSGPEAEAVVWVVDDVHYADDGLLDFVEHVATVAQAPILIVLLARPELLVRRPGLAALRRANVIGLETLSRPDIATLFDGLVEGLPQDVRDALIERAEGNPLYAIETVRAMNDQGLTVGGPTRTPGAVRLSTGVDAAQLSALAAPASLQVLVASRLDLLPPRERAVLAAGSVLGQTFTLAALAALTGEADALPDALHELTTRDLLTTISDRLSAHEGQYAFVQSVVRTVAYQTQSRRDRLDAHLAAVAHLEPLAEADGELSIVIAQHLRDAVALAAPDGEQRVDLLRRLGAWLERSAKRAVAVGAPADAVRSLVEALALAHDAADQVRLNLAVAEAALAYGSFEVTLEHAGRVISDLPAAGPGEIAGAVAQAAEASSRSGRLDEGGAWLQPYMAEGALADLPPLIASRMARQIAIYYGYTAQHELASAWQERALGLAEDSGDWREIARCLNACAVGFLQRGHPRIGLNLLELAAEVARQHHLVFELGLPLSNMIAYGLNRELGPALQAGHEAMSLSEQAGNSQQCWHVAVNQAIALTIAGRWDEVGQLRDRPLLREQPPESPYAAIIELELAIIAHARGEVVDVAALDALALLSEQGRPESYDTLYLLADRAFHARVTGDRSTLTGTAPRVVANGLKYCALDDDFPHVWAQAVGWLIDVQDFTGARALLRPVTDVAPIRWTPLLAAQLPRLRGTIEALDPASTTDPADVERDLLAAIEALAAFGAVPDRARAQAVLGRWLELNGRSADAAGHLAAARETFTELRAETWIEELDAAPQLNATG